MPADETNSIGYGHGEKKDYIVIEDNLYDVTRYVGPLTYNEAVELERDARRRGLHDDTKVYVMHLQSERSYRTSLTKRVRNAHKMAIETEDFEINAQQQQLENF